MSEGNNREGARAGFLASGLLFLNKPLFGRTLPGRTPALGVRLSLLGCAGSLALFSFLGPSGAVEEISLTPLVAELAPTLSLPVSLNERVNRWMERYLTDQRPAFERYLAREGLYSEMIKDALRARGMPEELFYLAAIESGFSPGATSRVSASGMWQFMGPTAQQFGLRIDEYVDERRDPVRATQAALDYLQALHAQFGSWYLAAAAYNAGPGRVARALRNHSGDQTGEEEIYWDIIDQLPRETRAYVPKMLALIVLGQVAENYGFGVVRAKPVEFDRVWVPGGTSLRWVASAVKVPASRIRELNPHLIRGVTPPNSLFPVRIPLGTSSMVVASGGSRWRTVPVDD